MFRLLCVVLLVLPLMGHRGCQHEHYAVEMTPKGDALTRTLSIHRHAEKGDLVVTPATLQRLAGVYPERLTQPASTQRASTQRASTQRAPTTQRFRGQWTRTTPTGIGGAGRFMHLTSPMGSTSAYVERFRGDDDQAGHLERARSVLDGFVDLMLRWLDHELAGKAQQASVHRFVDNTVRRDLHNLVLLGYAANLLQDSGEPVLEEIAMRAVLYLHEHGYVAPGRLPWIVSAMARSRDDDAAMLLGEVKRMLAKGAGQPDAVEVFAFLSTAKQAEAALEAFLMTTPEYAAELAKWEASKTGQASANAVDKPKPRPKPTVVIEALDGGFVTLLLDSKAHRLSVELDAPLEPFLHNGNWDAKAKRLRWIDSPMRSQPALPRLVFASWSVANPAYQTARFGRVVITGETLAEYEILRAGLSVAERTVWDAALAKVTPTDEASIARFRFSTETSRRHAVSDQFRRLLARKSADPASAPQ